MVKIAYRTNDMILIGKSDNGNPYKFYDLRIIQVVSPPNSQDSSKIQLQFIPFPPFLKKDDYVILQKESLLCEPFKPDDEIINKYLESISGIVISQPNKPTTHKFKIH